MPSMDGATGRSISALKADMEEVRGQGSGFQALGGGKFRV